jgi:3-phosphoshikimate 1-carboxyvinyltransferase
MLLRKTKKYFEPTADIIVKSSKLKAVNIEEVEMPRLIDELPILMVAASLAKGKSVFQGVQELRVKETDRINSMIYNLSKMGVKIEVKVENNKEVITIEGVKRFRGAELKSFGDHRTAMSMTIAALLADSPSSIDNVKCISKSFPLFFPTLKKALS